MYAAIDRHSPHQAIHLGDLMDDAEEVVARTAIWATRDSVTSTERWNRI